jgi:hypothetical protein
MIHLDTTYEMAGIAFGSSNSPRTALEALAQAMSKKLQESGRFTEAQNLSKNPEAFLATIPQGMVVFMAAAQEISTLRQELEDLRKTVNSMKASLWRQLQ